MRILKKNIYIYIKKQGTRKIHKNKQNIKKKFQGHPVLQLEYNKRTFGEYPEIKAKQQMRTNQEKSEIHKISKKRFGTLSEVYKRKKDVKGVRMSFHK